jgi:hypothetical protein
VDGDRKTEQEVVRHDEGVNYREAPKDLRTHSAICGNSCPNYTENGFHKTKSGVESKTEKMENTSLDATVILLTRLFGLKTLISRIKSGGCSRTPNILIFFSDPLQLVELVKRKKC